MACRIHFHSACLLLSYWIKLEFDLADLRSHSRGKASSTLKINFEKQVSAVCHTRAHHRVSQIYPFFSVRLVNYGCRYALVMPAFHRIPGNPLFRLGIYKRSWNKYINRTLESGAASDSICPKSQLSMASRYMHK